MATKKYLFVLVVVFTFVLIPKSALARQNCFTIHWQTNSSSNISAQQEREGIDFVTLNGASIVFYTEQGTVRSDGAKVIESKSLGCFTKNAMVVGRNEVSLRFVIGKGLLKISGTGSARFVLNQGEATERLLCDVAVSGSVPNNFSCNSQFVFDLKDLDPEVALEIEKIRSELDRLEREAQQNREDLGDIEEKLKKLAALDFENLDPVEISNVGSEIKELALFVENSKKDLAQLRQEALIEINKQKEQIRALLANDQEWQEKNAQVMGGPSNNQSISQMPSNSLKIDLASIQNSVGFSSQGEQEIATVIDSFQLDLARAIELRDTQKLAVAMTGWQSVLDFAQQYLGDEKSKVSTKGTLALTQKIKTVQDMLNGLFDSFGFLKTAPISIQTKANISGPLAKEFGSALVKAMIIALNRWQLPLTPEQQYYLENLDAFAELIRARAQLMLNQAGEEKAVTNQYQALFHDFVAVAQTGGRIVVGFTPVGKYIDFCEIITLKHNCVPNGEMLTYGEVAVTAVGLFVGSSMLWRELAKSSTVRAFTGAFGRAIGGLYDAIEQSVIKVLFKGVVQPAGKEIKATASLIKSSPVLRKMIENSEGKIEQEVVETIASLQHGSSKLKAPAIEKVFESAAKLGAKTKVEISEVIDITKAAGGKFEDLSGFINGKLTRYGPINPGPLHNIAEGTGKVADTFRSSSYFENTLEQPLKVYRVYSDDGRMLSKYWSRTKPSGPTQAMLDSALDPTWRNQATKWVEVTVPANEKIFEGIVGEIGLQRFKPPVEVGKILGGGSQVYIDTKISQGWITGGGKF